MAARPTVLVLGAGGNVSQGIQKALAHAPTAWRVVAACVSPRSAGLHLAEQAYLSPYADDPQFVEWVADVCRRERAVAVLSGVEPVLAALAPHAAALRADTGATVVVSPPEVLAVGADKLRTAQWLAAQGLPAPASAAADDAAAVAALAREHGWPLVVKPRGGKGAEAVRLVHDEDELAAARAGSGLVVQEHLGDAAEEFTVGCVSDRAGVLGSLMVLRRTLVHGTTAIAQAGTFPEVRGAAAEIVNALRPVGPCNVQMRLRDGVPVAFELNIRFSGTTPLRTRMGFAEVDAVLRHLAFAEPLAALRAPSGGTVVRYQNEVYVEDADVAALAAGHAIAGAGRVEDWGGPQ